MNEPPLFRHKPKLNSDNEDEIIKLINSGINVNELRPDNNTSYIMIAAAHSNFRIVRCLLEAGADVNIPSSDGATTLSHALYCHAHYDMIKLLLNSGANMGKKKCFVDGYGSSIDNLLLRYGVFPKHQYKFCQQNLKDKISLMEANDISTYFGNIPKDIVYLMLEFLNPQKIKLSCNP